MRLLFCCESYAPRMDGVQKVMQEIAERLVLRGHQVTVATSSCDQRKFNELNGVKIVSFAVSGNAVNGLCGEVNAYQSFVLNGPFDALLVKAAQQWTFDALIPIIHQIPFRKIHIPCGYSYLGHPRYLSYYEKMAAVLHEFDHLIYYSSQYQDIEFARKNGVTSYSVIPNGASEDEFSVKPGFNSLNRFGIAKDSFVFISVGTPPLSKGHLQILKAYQMAQLNRPSVLVLNGDFTSLNMSVIKQSLHHSLRACVKKILGRYQEDENQCFTKILKELQGDESKRVILANMPRKDLVSAFFYADLFVFASHREYSPLVLFEAAAAGLAFITIPVGNCREIAQWTKGGVICEAARDRQGAMRVQPVQLAHYLEKYLDSKAQLVAMGSEGRKNWFSKFTWNKIADLYEKVLCG